MNKESRVSLARMYYPVKTLGPGNRVGIWLNGCSRKCKNCISPELQAYDESKEVFVEDILRMIWRINEHIDGFTISGGEPFYKADALNELVKSLLSISDDILVYTGFTLEELISQNNKTVDSVIKNISVLVDGPYIEELNDNKGLRGSSNQRCWVFKNNEKYNGIESKERLLQSIVYGNKLLSIGIPQGDYND